MPTYEYLCTACQNHWEEVQKITEDAIEVCPRCGAHAAKRQISGGNFILKGGGWYADLYSSSSGKKEAKGDGKGEGASAEAKSDAKPDKTDAGTKEPAKKSESTAPPATSPPPAKSDSSK
jgi:putative FmdB family regulatory protein